MLITVLRLSDASSAQSASQRLGVLARLVRDRLLAVGVSAEAAALVQAPRARGGGWDCGDSGPLAARLAREEGGRRPGPGRDTLRRGTPLTGVGLESRTGSLARVRCRRVGRRRARGHHGGTAPGRQGSGRCGGLSPR